MAFLGRLFVVFFSFLIASLAAAIVLMMAVLMPAWQALADQGMPDGAAPFIAGFGALALSMTTLTPALLVIALAEAFRLRSFLIYAAAGGLGMVLLYSSIGLGVTGSPAMPRELEIMAASGIAAGLVYWLLAGRNAGRWHEGPLPPAT